jgi:hypothetical protein
MLAVRGCSVGVGKFDALDSKAMALSRLGIGFHWRNSSIVIKGTPFYFIKWTEVVPLKNMTHKEVIHFVLEHIMHRFGLP